MSKLRPLSIALIVIATGGCGKNEEAPPAVAQSAVPIPESATVIATTQTIKPGFEFPAIVEAIQHAEVHPEIAATLKANHFTAGQIVQQGDLLVELDDAQYKANLKAAQAELLSAEANAEQARTNWSRAEELMPKGYISALDYDKAKAAIGVADAGVARVKAQLDKVRLDVDHATIQAPFGGRISKPRYAVGDYVTPGGKPLFELVQLDPIYVTASIEQGTYNNFLLVREKMTREGIEIPKVIISLELAGDQIYPHQGEFENWSHAYTQSSGMLKGRAVFPNPDGMLLPGQNVTILGESIKSVQRVMVPQAAVLQDQQGQYVMALADDDTVQRRNVVMGVRYRSDWAVRSGLEEGERVIVQGAQFMRPGTKVTVVSGE